MLRKSKKKLDKIIVTCISESKSYETQVREYNIPENGSYSICNIGGDFIIYDDEKNITNRVNWQAGFTQEYEFFYKEVNNA